MKENARQEGREPNSISKMKPHERLFYVVLNQLKIPKSKRFGPALLTYLSTIVRSYLQRMH